MRDVPTDRIRTKQSRQIQKWILLNLESPAQTWWWKWTLYRSGYLFDWVHSYRPDSDIYDPYGKIVKRNSSVVEWKPKYEFTMKNKSVAWMVSHCETAGKREDYVAELKTFIDVDIYGRCGLYKCAKSNMNCLKMIEKNYKFYLSFENSICSHYVTEKLFRILDYDLIPVVFGGANYSSIMPPHSYIDAFNYSSPFELSLYLKEIASNEAKFNSYFKWKENYFVVSLPSYFCVICDKLAQEQRNQTTSKTSQITESHLSLYNWWFNNANNTCTSWKSPATWVDYFLEVIDRGFEFIGK
ncbi:unnamed protein product [Didymodactylos carnosus]|uniref:Fucosyltransferase n=1 Tax=Didymodactylos carnosus TaxID=1234261 RepID=A0A815KB56_9BILA|nr:unnamed protein product [Didymodactylos carnosus]CAF4285600.1 unnamed protein product [Didymodactylos carnosus]